MMRIRVTLLLCCTTSWRCRKRKRCVEGSDVFWKLFFACCKAVNWYADINWCARGLNSWCYGALMRAINLPATRPSQGIGDGADKDPLAACRWHAR